MGNTALEATPCALAGIGSVDGTNGFLVADVLGRSVGRVECPLYGTSPEEPDALAVQSGRIFGHHFIVPSAAIETIDARAEVIALRLERRQLRRFL